jgi:predicted glycoside hydrolase/deacetylase ChbG (UPF0249 family)
MSGSRFLIVNADDFGRSPGINAGIIKAHLDGIVTSTTLMVNLPWTDEAVRLAREHPSLTVGLHLNYCYRAPISETRLVRSLIDGRGNFEPNIQTLLKSANVEDISSETLAQLERFRALMGRDPSHLDSHKYLHSFPPFLAPVAAIAALECLPVRAIGDTDRAALSCVGVVTTDAFAGRFHGLDGDGVDLEILLAEVEQLRSGWTELMCHPGIVDEHILDSSYNIDREREIEALCSESVRETLVARSVQLASYDDLRKAC